MEVPPPTLSSLDCSGRVLYVGSLSKTLAPGLRLGYVVAPPVVMRELRALRRLMLRYVPGNNQRAVALFLALGHHEKLLRRFALAITDRVVMREALAAICRSAATGAAPAARASGCGARTGSTAGRWPSAVGPLAS